MHTLGYKLTPEGRIQELTRPEVNELWAGYSLWMEHVDPQTAGADESEQPSVDEQGRYRGSGKARNAGKSDQETERKFEQFKQQVNSQKAN